MSLGEVHIKVDKKSIGQPVLMRVTIILLLPSDLTYFTQFMEAIR